MRLLSRASLKKAPAPSNEQLGPMVDLGTVASRGEANTSVARPVSRAPAMRGVSELPAVGQCISSESSDLCIPQRVVPVVTNESVC